MKKRIIVTGASSGIGRAAAIELSKAGHELVLVARREAALKEVAQECGGAEVVVSDLSDLSAIPALIEKLKKADRYPVLINSAGIGKFNLYKDLDWANIEATILINQLSPMRLIHSILPWMLEAGGGQIINVLSRVATQVMPGASAYSASKAGLLILANTISQEYRREGIKMTNLLPGAVDTPIWDGMSSHPDRADMIPMEVVGEVIADLVNRPLNHNVDELMITPVKGIL